MIKMDGAKMTDIVMVDYQLMHYGCPILDFLYFIFLNTDKTFRDAHLTELKDLYHDTLSTFLEYFNIDVEFVYPRKMFDQVYKEKLGYGLLVGFAILPLMLVPKDNAPDLTQGFSGLSLQTNELFIERQRGMIEEFIQWGYIV